jgi:hypothetical protein
MIFIINKGYKGVRRHKTGAGDILDGGCTGHNPPAQGPSTGYP